MTFARFPQMISIIRQAVKHKRTSCVVSTNKFCRQVLTEFRKRGYILGFAHYDGYHSKFSPYRHAPKVIVYLSSNAYKFFRLSRLYPKTTCHFHRATSQTLYHLRKQHILVTTSKGLKWSSDYQMGKAPNVSPTWQYPGGILLVRILN